MTDDTYGGFRFLSRMRCSASSTGTHVLRSDEAGKKWCEACQQDAVALLEQHTKPPARSSRGITSAAQSITQPGATAHPEVQKHVEAATRVAESFIVAAHRTGSVEYLLAGFRDQAGWEPMPTQIAKAQVATCMLGRAAQTRHLTEGDAAFALNTMGWAWPNRTLAYARTAVFDPVITQEDVQEQIERFRELALWARSIGDIALERSLTSIADICAAYEQPWLSPALLVRLHAPNKTGLRLEAAARPNARPGLPKHRPPGNTGLDSVQCLEATGRAGLQIGCLLLVVAAGLVGIATSAAIFGSGFAIATTVIAVIVLAALYTSTK